jgi:hypothetical protein
MNINKVENLKIAKKIKINNHGLKKDLRVASHELFLKKETQLLEQIVQRNLTVAADKLNIDSQNLVQWMSLQGCHSTLGRNGFLRAICEHDLDPFNGEIIFIQSVVANQSSWPFITIEGWAKLINQHPQFCGLEFTMLPSENSMSPIWMECSIYRKDRIKPITVREYLTEVITENSYWQERPNRMLRYRALSQCAKLALGISLPEKSSLESQLSCTIKVGNLKNERDIPATDKNRIAALKEILINK